MPAAVYFGASHLVWYNIRVFKAGILIISDKRSKGERLDESGPVAQEMLSVKPFEVAKYEIVPDEKKIISARIKEWVDKLKLDLIVTSGGTGTAPRDVTPEATREVIEREIPGMGEAMRAVSLKVTSFAMLSRAIAGSRGKSLIINLPGSPKSVRECLEVVLPVVPHTLELLAGKTFEGPHERTVY